MTKPMRVFVCSPLRAPTPEGYALNIKLARELTLAVLRAGHAPYTPHLWYSELLDDRIESERKLGMAAGAAWLRVADEIWVYADSYDQCSAGMKSEVEAAQKFALPLRVVFMPPAFEAVRTNIVMSTAKVTVAPVALLVECDDCASSLFGQCDRHKPNFDSVEDYTKEES